MAATKGKSSKLDFHIKLLSGNSVVLVEANGFESEIFVPLIVNGRITFQNIIPNRRCYHASEGFSNKRSKHSRILFSLPASISNNETNEGKLLPHSTHRMSAGQDGTPIGSVPLANSTPATGSNEGRGNGLRKRLQHREIDSSTDGGTTLPSPELQRKSVPTPCEVVRETLMQNPSGIKIMRLYRNSTEGTPKRVGRLVATNTNHVSNLTPVPPDTSPRTATSNAFRLYTTPSPSKDSSGRSTSSHIIALQKPKLQSPNCTTKWRKCITPVRTYTRRKNNVTVFQRPASGNSVKRKARSVKVLPTYMENPTQGTKATHDLEVRKRKLIIDPKVVISPRTFKEQQQHNLTATDLKSKNDSSGALPQSRKQLKTSSLSAFDLLTNSNRSLCMSSKLKQQFRKGCVNKASSTYPKYKELCDILPLKQDEQVCEMGRQ